MASAERRVGAEVGWMGVGWGRDIAVAIRGLQFRMENSVSAAGIGGGGARLRCCRDRKWRVEIGKWFTR